MISEMIIKGTIIKYVKKYNNRQLKDTYLSLKKKSNRTHTDNLFIKICVDEMKKRGMVNTGE